MRRLANLKVGARLGLAFGLVAVLLVATVLVGISSGASQSHSSSQLQGSNSLTRDALQVKFRSADFNGWQTVYAFDIFRGAPGAMLDTGDSRKAFLDSANSFRAELGQLQHNQLTGSQQAMAREISAQFDKFMSVDNTIIADYRSGTPVAVAAANKLVLNDEITIFQQLATATDKLVASIKSQSQASGQASVSAASSGKSMMITMGVIALIVSMGCAILITRSIVRPLHDLDERLADIADGDGDLTAR